MIEINITHEILQEANDRHLAFYDRFGNNGTHRIDKNKQRMIGYIAEACIVHAFPDIAYSTDYRVDFNIDNTTIDSKSQGCNSKPLPYYNATLYEEQKQREVDYYIFSRVKNDFTKCWVCGIISKTKFFQIATLKPVGTITNNFTYDQSRYEIQYKDLKGVSEFITWHNGFKNQKTTV